MGLTARLHLIQNDFQKEKKLYDKKFLFSFWRKSDYILRNFAYLLKKNAISESFHFVK